MRKSKAVEIVSKMLENYDLIISPGRPTYDKFAEAIVNTLQDYGMMPPKIVNPAYDYQLAVKYGQHPFLKYDVAYMVNEWESENA